MEVETVIAICGLAVSVATFFIGRMTSAKNSGAADGELKADIKHIKDSLEKQDAKFDKQDAKFDKQATKLDGIVTSYEDVKVELEKVKGRVYTLEQKIKILHGE